MKKDKLVNLGSILFYLAYILYIVFYVLVSHSELSSVINLYKLNNIIKILTIIFLSIKILFIDIISFKSSLLYLFLIFVFYKSYLINLYDIPFFTMLFIISAQNIDYKKFLKWDIILKFSLIIFIISLSLLNIIPNTIQITNSVTKYGLGFKHPNYLSIFFVSSIIELICLKGGLKSKFSYLFLLFSFFFIYFFTRSRTSLFIFLFVLFIYLILKKYKSLFDNVYVKFIFIFLPLILFVLNLFMIIAYHYGNDIIYLLNDFLSNRIKCAYEFLSEYNPTLFGQRLLLIGTKYAKFYGVKARVLDMAFIHLILRNGIIIFVSFIVTLIINQKSLIKSKKLELLMASTFFIISALSETYVYNLSVNFILINTLGFFDNKKKVDS